MKAPRTVEKAGKIAYDVCTWPNLITLMRIRMAHRIAYDFYEDPKNTWRTTAVFLSSDKVDGLGAKQPLRWLQKLGWRKSEIGRQIDPIADKYAGSLVLIAGLAANAFPRALGSAVLAQKALTAGNAVHARAQGVDLEVNEFGRASEVATGVGLGLFSAAREIENPKLQRGVECTGYGLTFAGLACAGLAHLEYRRQAEEQLQHPTEP